MRLDARVTTYSIAEAAEVLGVSDDTARRWVDSGRLPADSTGGRLLVTGADLARVAEQTAGDPDATPRQHSSARNHLPGIVTRVVTDTVMAQVELQCGRYRLVSLLSREAVEEMGLEVGVRATASVKSTNVVVNR